MSAVDEIKRRIDPVAYIGRTVRLQKAGRNFRGLCPFHTEKTPSFYVFPDRGTWRCFGACSEGGDLFSFVMKRDNCSFREALAELAREAGVSLAEESPERRSRREHLARVVSAAVAFYESQLRSPDGEEARAYLERRGLEPETVAAWHLGWAPDDWRVLRDHLAARGYSDEDLLATGLAVTPEHGAPYDRFRGRIIIPIADERGVFVGLAGRSLRGEEPKYLNSPQTELFDKGRLLFGLHEAAAAIRESGAAIVVEGYFDVIGPWQEGFRNVVATMGTSLTAEHAKVLRRWAKRIVLALDPDAAGFAAAERAGDVLGAVQATRGAESLAAAADIELFVAQLPQGRDPDEVARAAPEEWRRLIAEAKPFPEFVLQRLVGGERPGTPAEIRAAIERAVPVLLALRNPVDRGIYVQRLAHTFGVSEPAIWERLRQARRSATLRPVRRGSADPERPSREDIFLAVLLRYPTLREHARHIPETLFADALNRGLFAAWRDGRDWTSDELLRERAERLSRVRLPDSLPPQEARRAATEALQRLLRDRQSERLAAAAAELAELEARIGSAKLAEAAWRLWMGEDVDDPGAADAAHKVFEAMELGRALHRPDVPEFQ
ncbi:DNA primase [bacterium HR29]|jgi:DNA primase|nr:DNA primase [bacterium HR29]